MKKEKQFKIIKYQLIKNFGNKQKVRYFVAEYGTSTFYPKMRGKKVIILDASSAMAINKKEALRHFI